MHEFWLVSGHRICSSSHNCLSLEVDIVKAMSPDIEGIVSCLGVVFRLLLFLSGICESKVPQALVFIGVCPAEIEK